MKTKRTIELLNNYKLNGKMVIEYGYDFNEDIGHSGHYVILEDGEKLWFSKKYALCFQIQCFKCKRWSKPYLYIISREDKKNESVRKCGIARKYWMCLSCMKNGEGNPMFGENIKDHMTEEAYKECCRKRSIKSTGKNNPMYGKNIKDYMTEEAYNLWRQHLVDANVAIENDPIRSEQRRINLSNGLKRAKERDPNYYSKIKAKGGISTTSNSGFYKMSKPEIKVEKWLKENKIDYEYSPIMSNGKRNFQFDFIVHKKRILIEVQGDYWHGNPLFYDENELNEHQLKKIELDKLKVQYAKDHNFQLIPIWENEIDNNDFSKLSILLS